MEKMKKLKIVFASANPDRDLNLEEEYREIESAIKSSPYSNEIELVTKLSARFEDIFDAINIEKPDILHFSGHGEGADGLRFILDENEDIFIDADVLNDLFETEESNLKLVFLNACYSEEQAVAIKNHIDYVIGMKGDIEDKIATTFAKIFYKSISSDKSIKMSFKQARTMLKAQYRDNETIPQLLQKNSEVADFKISALVQKEEQSEEKEAKKDTTINIKGDITGVVSNSGTVHQTINKKTIQAKTNIENIDNKDGGTINF